MAEKVTVVIKVEDTIPAMGSHPSLSISADNERVTITELGPCGGSGRVISMPRRQWLVALETMQRLEVRMAAALDQAKTVVGQP